MPKFKIEKKEPKGVKRITFNKDSDYTAIKMKSSGNVVLVHAEQAAKLVKKGLATIEKNISLEESIPARTTKPVKNAPVIETKK